MAARRLSLSLVVSGALIVLTSFVRADDVTLRWKFTEGQTLAQTMEVKMAITTNFGGMEVKSKQTTLMDYDWTVKKVGADGKADVVQKIERIRMQMAMPGGQNIDYDSKDGKDIEGPAGAMMMPIFKAMVGAEFKLQMSPQGKVENVKLPEGMLKALQQIPGAAAAGGMFNEDTLKQMCEAFPALFDGPITTGKTWNDHKKIPFPFGTMHADNTYTYQGIEKRSGKDLHKFALKVALSLQKDPSQQIDIKLKPNESSGTLYFDGDLGRFVEMVQNQRISMEVGSAGAPGVETSNETTTTWRIEEKAAAPKEAEKKAAEAKKDAK